MSLKRIEDVFLCSDNGEEFTIKDNIVTCNCKEYKVEEGQIVILDPNLTNIPATIARDRQAENYLKHMKHPVQTYRLKEWINKLPENLFKGRVLDLGCGPGPTPKLILEKEAKNIFAIDFSIESLRVNQRMCDSTSNKLIYLLKDLRNIKLKKDKISILIMADFLQHIINKRDRDVFLKEAFESLIPGGCFYLSFFNINIKNYINGDIYGAFSSGSIVYERLDYRNLIASFPENIIVDKVIPLNISNNILVDRLIGCLPFSRLLSRWTVIQGRKIGEL